MLISCGNAYQLLSKYKGQKYSQYERDFIDDDDYIIIGSVCDIDGSITLDELEEEVWNGIYNCDEDYISYDSDGDLHMGKKISKEYDAVFIRNNEFMIQKNIEIPETLGFNFADTKSVEGSSLFDFTNYAMSLIYSNEIGAKTTDIERAYMDGDSQYCQDGIWLPLLINRLFPIGFTRIYCNCTADARFHLNVTRHNVSENHDDVDLWLSHTGKQLQQEILNQFLLAFQELKIDIDIREWVQNIDDFSDYFSVRSLKQLKEIIGI